MIEELFHLPKFSEKYIQLDGKMRWESEKSRVICED